MTLSKTDLKKIKDLLDSGNNLVIARMDRFESYVLKRFNQVDVRFDQVDREIKQLIKTEDEDIGAAFKDIQALKTRQKRLESKIYSH